MAGYMLELSWTLDLSRSKFWFSLDDAVEYGATHIAFFATKYWKQYYVMRELRKIWVGL
jgi:hypothetical protein